MGEFRLQHRQIRGMVRQKHHIRSRSKSIGLSFFSQDNGELLIRSSSGLRTCAEPSTCARSVRGCWVIATRMVSLCEIVSHRDLHLGD